MIYDEWPGAGKWNPDRFIVRCEIDDTVLYYVDDVIGWTAQRSLALQLADELSAAMFTKQLSDIFKDRNITCEKITDAEKNPLVFFEHTYGIKQINYFHAVRQAHRRLKKRDEKVAAEVERQKQRDKIRAAKTIPKDSWWR